MTPEMRDALQQAGRQVAFSDGEILRHKGAFAPDMLLITKGNVDCLLSEADAVHVTVGPGAVVGEVGFLTGTGANATLRAVGPVEALSLDSTALQKVQRNAPSIAAEVLRHLARLMSERQEQNEELLTGGDQNTGSEVEIIRCSTLDQLRAAQRLRYDVCCIELRQNSPFADPEEGILVEDLDQNGTSFIAVQAGLTIGAARVNLGRDGGLGVLPELYGIDASPFSLEESAIMTHHAIRDSHRHDRAHLQFMDAVCTYAQAAQGNAIFIDCAPQLAPSYRELGFEQSADDFVHPENGLSVPMVLNLSAFFDRIRVAET